MKKVEQPKQVAKLTLTEEKKVFTTTNTKKEVKPHTVGINVRLEAFNLITKYEWFHETPYWDSVRYAYWYWQPAPSKNATITEKESQEFVYGRIDDYIKQHDLDSVPPEIQVALLSFRYNLWRMPHWYRWFIDNWHYNALWNRMKQYVYSGWKRLQWLVKRRNAEVSYFYK